MKANESEAEKWRKYNVALQLMARRQSEISMYGMAAISMKIAGASIRRYRKKWQSLCVKRKRGAIKERKRKAKKTENSKATGGGEVM